LQATVDPLVKLHRDIHDEEDADAAREAIAAFGAALELVDLGPPEGAERIVATNISIAPSR
jgi:hypothetical protein